MKEKRTISLSVAVLIFGAMLSAVVLVLVPKLGTGVAMGAAVAVAGVTAVIATSGFLFWIVRELERNEERLRLILESAYDGIVTTNEFGVIDSVNTSVTTLFGYRPGKLIGEHVSVLLSSVHGESGEGETLRAYFSRVDLGDSGVPHEVEGLRQDGRKFPMDIFVNAAEFGGEIFYTVMLRDITERVAAQAEIRASKNELERRVKERTGALEESNARLHEEIVRRKALIQELQEALRENKALSGLLPICASCKKIRDDKGYWNQIEVYIRDHSDAEFSHGICPECIRDLYPEIHEPISDS